MRGAWLWRMATQTANEVRRGQPRGRAARSFDSSKVLVRAAASWCYCLYAAAACVWLLRVRRKLCAEKVVWWLHQRLDYYSGLATSWWVYTLG
jgi:hypothetical protein